MNKKELFKKFTKLAKNLFKLMRENLKATIIIFAVIFAIFQMLKVVGQNQKTFKRENYTWNSVSVITDICIGEEKPKVELYDFTLDGVVDADDLIVAIDWLWFDTYGTGDLTVINKDHRHDTFHIINADGKVADSDKTTKDFITEKIKNLFDRIYLLF